MLLSVTIRVAGTPAGDTVFARGCFPPGVPPKQGLSPLLHELVSFHPAIKTWLEGAFHSAFLDIKVRYVTISGNGLLMLLSYLLDLLYYYSRHQLVSSDFEEKTLFEKPFHSAYLQNKVSHTRSGVERIWHPENIQGHILVLASRCAKLQSCSLFDRKRNGLSRTTDNPVQMSVHRISLHRGIWRFQIRRQTLGSKWPI